MPIPYDKKQKYRLLDEVGFKQYFQAEKWEDFNRQFFDGLAHKYDALNEVLSFGQHLRIKRKALQRIGIQPGSRILDLCTGSGDVALMIAKQYPDCQVIGGDVSEKMLEIARRRGQGLANLRFQTADVLRLPFPDQTFDGVVISFGLRNLEDLHQGILEMKRVIKPQGFLANLDLGHPPKGILSWIYDLYFGMLIPFLGRHIFHRGEFNSFQYLPSSARYFPEQGKLVEIFGELGFQNIRRYDYLCGSISQQVGRNG